MAEYPLLRYGRDAKRSLLAKAVFGKNGVRSVLFLPMLIEKQYRPEVLRADDPRFETWCATWIGLRKNWSTASSATATRS